MQVPHEVIIENAGLEELWAREEVPAQGSRAYVHSQDSKAFLAVQVGRAEAQPALASGSGGVSVWGGWACSLPRTKVPQQMLVAP